MCSSDLEKHLSTAKPWLDILIDQSRSASPVELEEFLKIITLYLTDLPDGLQSRYLAQVEKKLNISRRDLKRLMNQQEDNNGSLYSEIRERRLHFMGDPLGPFQRRSGLAFLVGLGRLAELEGEAEVMPVLLQARTVDLLEPFPIDLRQLVRPHGSLDLLEC